MAAARIIWIDAMKALLALSVVMVHACERLVAPMPEWLVTLKMILVIFAVPGFTFLSGYLAYHHGERISGPQAVGRIGRRVRALVVPSVVFIVLTLGLDALTEIAQLKVGVYYFLVSLANIFVIYYLLRGLCGSNDSRFLMALVVVTMLMSIILALWHNSPAPDYLHWRETCDLMLFFTLGVIVKAQRDRLRAFACSRILALLLLLAAIALIMLFPLYASGWQRILRSIVAVAAISVVFYTFRGVFARPILSKLSHFIGRRTLSLYAIHPAVIVALVSVGVSVSVAYFPVLYIGIVAAALVIELLCMRHPILHGILFGKQSVA